MDHTVPAGPRHMRIECVIDQVRRVDHAIDTLVPGCEAGARSNRGLLKKRLLPSHELHGGRWAPGEIAARGPAWGRRAARDYCGAGLLAGRGYWRGGVTGRGAGYWRGGTTGGAGRRRGLLAGQGAAGGAGLLAGRGTGGYWRGGTTGGAGLLNLGLPGWGYYAAVA